MKQSCLILAGIALLCIPVMAQQTRCDAYGYEYCYLRLKSDILGPIVYDDNGHPVLEAFPTADPTSYSKLYSALGRIPLRICFLESMFLDRLFHSTMGYSRACCEADEHARRLWCCASKLPVLLRSPK